MKGSLAALLGSLAVSTVDAFAVPDVDTRFPYTGPKIPIGDWVNPTVKGNGKGFPRLVEPPAVVPDHKNPTNNVNVISVSYLPHGVHIHYQTPFGLGAAPTISWGTSRSYMSNIATGTTSTYDRTPPCSLVSVTQCSQFFHEIQLRDLAPNTEYFYKIMPGNGTTASEVMSFTTARAPGDQHKFTVAVVNDMGYTNAAGTHKYMSKGVDDGEINFVWHGGDLSYADDWYSGILPCDLSSWPVCYNGSHTELPGGGAIPPEYLVPLPHGEIPNQGGPEGGDMSVIYESNWDLWQQWMNEISTKVPYMVLPGNHEGSCAEFDGGKNIMTAYLNDDRANSSAPKEALTYYSCPPSQRNFTTFQYRFRMPGPETGGVGNFWYSFNYGLAHFVSIDTETDFPYSPEYPFARDVTGNEALPKENETEITDAGPFGYVRGDINSNKAYEQYNWLAADLAAVDRTKTPWLFVMGHRPMYSSQVSGYQSDIRNAFEDLFLEHKVDAYMAGHIHWYERLVPLGKNGTINEAAIVNKNTYKTGNGKSLCHLVNGQGGNVESHSELDGDPRLNITAVLNAKDYGYSTLTVYNSTTVKWSFIKGADGSAGDELTIVKA